MKKPRRRFSYLDKVKQQAVSWKANRCDFVTAEKRYRVNRIKLTENVSRIRDDAGYTKNVKVLSYLADGCKNHQHQCRRQSSVPSFRQPRALKAAFFFSLSLLKATLRQVYCSLRSHFYITSARLKLKIGDVNRSACKTKAHPIPSIWDCARLSSTIASGQRYRRVPRAIDRFSLSRRDHPCTPYAPIIRCAAADHYLFFSKNDRSFLRRPLSAPPGLAGQNV